MRNFYRSTGFGIDLGLRYIKVWYNKSCLTKNKKDLKINLRSCFCSEDGS